MRLLNVHTLQLESFLNEKTRPPYAILSHTWLPDAEEVGFEDLLRYHEAVTGQNQYVADSIASRAGFKKIQGCCQTAAQSDNLEWAWIDTCCIDKRSSAELSEAINSMFKWYQDAKRCYVFLQDVTGSEKDPSFRSSKWFTRGWTLQELLAPRLLSFYDREWQLIGTINDDSVEKMDDDSQLCDVVSSITSIPVAFLKGAPLTDACVAKRMSWASQRETTRPEDVAYSLLGIFDVNMPLLYGEGHKAFVRLQEEIINRIHDDSILAWGTIDTGAIADHASIKHHDDTEELGALASSPADFGDCWDLEIASGFLHRQENLDFQVTPAGIRVGVNIYCRGDYYSICELSCFAWRHPSQPIMILLGRGPLAGTQRNYSTPYSQCVRKGRNLWCGRVTPWPRPFLVMPSALTLPWLSAAPPKTPGVSSTFWYRHPSYTITLAKDITSGTLRSIQARDQVWNIRESTLVPLNLPDNHTYSIEYTSPGIKVSTNTHRLGNTSLRILYSDESPNMIRLSLVAILILLDIPIFALAIWSSVEFNPRFAALLVINFIVVPFILVIILYWPLLDEVASTVFRRIWMFMLGKGGGPLVNQRTIRACIRIMEQTPSKSSKDANQMMVIICYQPAIYLRDESFPILLSDVTCYIAPVSTRRLNEEDFSLRRGRWLGVYKTLNAGDTTYVQRTQHFTPPRAAFGFGKRVVSFTIEVIREK
ncbi:heterokaryon incompatibility protein-domain-containing protein [Nemania serpens]|nr:heterokaryon incompatibility protein-domain-containing protein [Nemania serpens]